jgi:threonine dehydrogenase-like Zn-dependent dehydrogenase
VRGLSLLERQKVNVKPFISEILPLKEWERGLDLAKSGNAIKVLFNPEA